MREKLFFYIIISSCSIFGFFIALLNNKIIVENSPDNLKNKNTNINKNVSDFSNITKTKNITKNDTYINKNVSDFSNITETINRTNNDTYKNKIIHDNDLLNEEDNNNKENKESKEINKNIIEIAIGIDSKYVLQAVVFITSLLENKKKSSLYKIFIMTADDVNDEDRKILNKLMDKYGKDNLIINLYDMKYSFNDAYSDSHVSKAAYYRINLPSLLPNLDRVIYSDIDVVNFEDLYELYNLEFKKNIYFRGILDYANLANSLAQYGVKTKKYMNSGLMVINLKEIRNNGVEKKIIDFVNSHKYLSLYDQTAINAVCNNNFEKIPLKYNRFNFGTLQNIMNFNNNQDKKYRYNDAEIKEAFYSPVMLHYAGWEKPWLKDKICGNRGYWWYYAKKTEYYEELLEKYKFTDEEIMGIFERETKEYNFIRNKS